MSSGKPEINSIAVKQNSFENEKQNKYFTVFFL